MDKLSNEEFISFLESFKDNKKYYDTITEIAKGNCTETYYKDAKIVMQNVCSVATIVGYEIRDGYAFVVFNNFACAIFDLSTLTVSHEEFIEFIDTTISKNKLNKYKR